MLTQKQQSHENKRGPLNHVTVEFCQNKLHLLTGRLSNETKLLSIVNVQVKRSTNDPGKGKKVSDHYIRIILGWYWSSSPQIHPHVFSLE